MDQRKEVNKKGQRLIVGLFFLILGIIFLLAAPVKKLKEMVFSEMKLAIYQEEINEDNTTINSVPVENIVTSPTDGSAPPVVPEPPKISYTYVGQLSIPSIRLKRGFVSKNSKYNDINYNITIAKEADYPDVPKGNFILMAHSGNSYISFFDNLYKLELGDVATVSYEAKAYYYKLVKSYEVEKTGKIAIFRDYNKKTLTLITCNHNNLEHQSIYIFEQTKE